MTCEVHCCWFLMVGADNWLESEVETGLVEEDSIALRLERVVEVEGTIVAGLL